MTRNITISLLLISIHFSTHQKLSLQKVERKEQIEVLNYGTIFGTSKIERSSYYLISYRLCAICLERMLVKEISALRCGHLFHFRCIKYWLNEQETCPECRKPSKIDDIVSSLYFHDDMDDKKSETTSSTHSDSDSTDDSEKLDSYDVLLRKLEDAYMELRNEKLLHKQTKEFLNKVQDEKLELVKIIQTMVGNNGE